MTKVSYAVKALAYFCTKWAIVFASLVLMREGLDVDAWSRWEETSVLILIIIACTFWFFYLTNLQWEFIAKLIGKEKQVA